MAGEEQERFEDYLELERYIEDLQEGRPARLPHDLTPEQARVYRMAVLFRAAASEHAHGPNAETSEPRPDFVSGLYAHLRDMEEDSRQPRSVIPPSAVNEPGKARDDIADPRLDQPTVRLGDRQAQSVPSGPAITPPPPEAAAQDTHEQQEKKSRQSDRPGKKRIVSRRSLFTGGAVAAASLATGVGGGLIIAQLATPQKPLWPKTLVDGVPIDWHLVAPLANLGTHAIKFVAETVVGYVICDEGTNQVRAFSAACTHMGCIVQWNDAARRFDCPCHNGRFNEYGQPDPTSAIKYLVGLPSLTVKVGDDGNIYVAVPKTSPVPDSTTTINWKNIREP